MGTKGSLLSAPIYYLRTFEVVGELQHRAKSCLDSLLTVSRS